MIPVIRPIYLHCFSVVLSRAVFIDIDINLVSVMSRGQLKIGGSPGHRYSI